MRPSTALAQHRSRIREIARLHHFAEVKVFGSTARGMDAERSDLDLLVEPTGQTTLFDLGALRSDLQDLLGIDVDLLTPNSLPAPYRTRVLDEARPV